MALLHSDVDRKLAIASVLPCMQGSFMRGMAFFLMSNLVVTAISCKTKSDLLDDDGSELQSVLNLSDAVSVGRSLAGRIKVKELILSPGVVYDDANLEPGEIAITIDDGPRGNITSDLLQLLEAYEVKATFFLVGKNVHGGVSLISKMIAAGHSVANHSWVHSYFDDIMTGQVSGYRGVAGVKAQIDETDRALLSALGGEATNRQKMFRFPGGESRTIQGLGSGERQSLINTVKGDRGKAVIHWNIDTHDTSVPNRRLVEAWRDCGSSGSDAYHSYGKRFCEVTLAAKAKFGSISSMNLAEKSELVQKLTLEMGLFSIQTEQGGIMLMHDKFAYSGYYLNGILKELAQPDVLLPLATKIAQRKGIPVKDFRFTAVVLKTQ
jgi:peptidoglycan/xylan/chitin deacetylase (PgdA/CDA1 family)